MSTRQRLQVAVLAWREEWWSMVIHDVVKRASTVVLGLWLSLGAAHAATPEAVTYRGSLTDNGQTAANGQYTVQYALYDAATGGARLAEIAAHPVTVTDGRFQDDIGALFGVSTATAFLEVGVTLPGTTTVDVLPRVKLAAVPFAARASVADVADTVEWTHVSGRPEPLQGVPGPQGMQGAQGVAGATGPTGPAGSNGSQGVQGVQGTQGPAGAAGASVVAMSVPAGTGPCVYGGSSFTVGASTTYACNGAPGAAGSGGGVKVASAKSFALTYLGSTCAHYTDAQVALAAPGPGTVVVSADYWFRFGHVTGTEDQLQAAIGTSATECDGNPEFESHITLPAAAATASGVDQSGHVQRVFTVAAAGTTTYYLNAKMVLGGTASMDDRFWAANLVATFYPN